MTFTFSLERALTAEGIPIPIRPGKATTLVNRTLLFTKKISYGGTDFPFRICQSLDYSSQQQPVAEAVDGEVFWLTDALPILTRRDLDHIIAAIRKVSTAFLARLKS